jgi:hypothetical protein
MKFLSSSWKTLSAAAATAAILLASATAQTVLPPSSASSNGSCPNPNATGAHSCDVIKPPATNDSGVLVAPEQGKMPVIPPPDKQQPNEPPKGSDRTVPQ